ncbi:MAG TPA: GNAT family N-acyltransferase, partial [Thermoanaerobaculia bacterium]|nr:GNAT family N-acyltransferase [Thermoanaerobaculia bacterium]
MSLAASEAEIREAQALRYRVFALEQGAHLPSARAGLDADEIDPLCDHLLVRDCGSGEVVASTRLLSAERAAARGGFYSQGEFELGAVLELPGRMLEIGRTCVAQGHRDGATIALLWAGLADYVAAHRFDYLIGCASIDLAPGFEAVRTLVAEILDRHGAPEGFRVRPRLALPAAPARFESGRPEQASGVLRLPPLLRAYFRLGAQACGEACWDPDFKVADVFILLELSRLAQRYGRHFLERAEERGGQRRDGPRRLAAPRAA